MPLRESHDALVAAFESLLTELFTKPVLASNKAIAQSFAKTAGFLVNPEIKALSADEIQELVGIFVDHVISKAHLSEAEAPLAFSDHATVFFPADSEGPLRGILSSNCLQPACFDTPIAFTADDGEEVLGLSPLCNNTHLKNDTKKSLFIRMCIQAAQASIYAAWGAEVFLQEATPVLLDWVQAALPEDMSLVSSKRPLSGRNQDRLKQNLGSGVPGGVFESAIAIVSTSRGESAVVANFELKLKAALKEMGVPETVLDKLENCMAVRFDHATKTLLINVHLPSDLSEEYPDWTDQLNKAFETLVPSYVAETELDVTSVVVAGDFNIHKEGAEDPTTVDFSGQLRNFDYGFRLALGADGSCVREEMARHIVHPERLSQLPTGHRVKVVGLIPQLRNNRMKIDAAAKFMARRLFVSSDCRALLDRIQADLSWEDLQQHQFQEADYRVVYTKDYKGKWVAVVRIKEKWEAHDAGHIFVSPADLLRGSNEKTADELVYRLGLDKNGNLSAQHLSIHRKAEGAPMPGVISSGDHPVSQVSGSLRAFFPNASAACAGIREVVNDGVELGGYCRAIARKFSAPQAIEAEVIITNLPGSDQKKSKVKLSPDAYKLSVTLGTTKPDGSAGRPTVIKLSGPGGLKETFTSKRDDERLPEIFTALGVEDWASLNQKFKNELSAEARKFQLPKCFQPGLTESDVRQYNALLTLFNAIGALGVSGMIAAGIDFKESFSGNQYSDWIYQPVVHLLVLAINVYATGEEFPEVAYVSITPEEEKLAKKPKKVKGRKEPSYTEALAKALRALYKCCVNSTDASWLQYIQAQVIGITEALSAVEAMASETMGGGGGVKDTDAAPVGGGAKEAALLTGCDQLRLMTCEFFERYLGPVLYYKLHNLDANGQIPKEVPTPFYRSEESVPAESLRGQYSQLKDMSRGAVQEKAMLAIAQQTMSLFQPILADAALGARVEIQFAPLGNDIDVHIYNYGSCDDAAIGHIWQEAFRQGFKLVGKISKKPDRVIITLQDLNGLMFDLVIQNVSRNVNSHVRLYDAGFWAGFQLDQVESGTSSCVCSQTKYVASGRYEPHVVDVIKRPLVSNRRAMGHVLKAFVYNVVNAFLDGDRVSPDPSKIYESLKNSIEVFSQENHFAVERFDIEKFKEDVSSALKHLVEKNAKHRDPVVAEIYHNLSFYLRGNCAPSQVGKRDVTRCDDIVDLYADAIEAKMPPVAMVVSGARCRLGVTGGVPGQFGPAVSCGILDPGLN
jgi:hypothetical protein